MKTAAQFLEILFHKKLVAICTCFALASPQRAFASSVSCELMEHIAKEVYTIRVSGARMEELLNKHILTFLPERWHGDRRADEYVPQRLKVLDRENTNLSFVPGRVLNLNKTMTEDVMAVLEHLKSGLENRSALSDEILANLLSKAVQHKESLFLVVRGERVTDPATAGLGIFFQNPRLPGTQQVPLARDARYQGAIKEYLGREPIPGELVEIGKLVNAEGYDVQIPVMELIKISLSFSLARFDGMTHVLFEASNGRGRLYKRYLKEEPSIVKEINKDEVLYSYSREQIERIVSRLNDIEFKYSPSPGGGTFPPPSSRQ